MHLKNFILVFISLFSSFTFAQSLEWGITSGTGTDISFAYGLCGTTDGANVMSGVFAGTVDFDPGIGEVNCTSEGNEDIFIQKVDAEGELVWVKCVGGEKVDISTCITSDLEGNVFIAGYFIGTADFDPGPDEYNLIATGDPINGQDAFILKLNADGDFVWAKSYGGDMLEFNNDIELDAEGNIYCVGLFQGTADLDPGEGVSEQTGTGTGSIYGIKLDANGDLIWAYTIDGYEAHGNSAYHVEVSELGEMIIAGHFSETVDFDASDAEEMRTVVGARDSYLIKINADGEMMWVSTWGGTGAELTYMAVFGDDGDVYVTGQFYNTVIVDAPDGENEIESNGAGDVFVGKMDNNGNFQWIKQFGGSFTDAGRGIFFCADGNLAFAGIYQQIADFDPSDNVFELDGIAGYDAYIGKLNSSGKLLWVESLGGAGADFGAEVVEDASSNLYLCGAFSLTADLDPGEGVLNQTSMGEFDAYLIKLSGVLSIDALYNDRKLSAYPNPTNGNFNIDLEKEEAAVAVKIYSLTGELVFTKTYFDQRLMQLSLQNLATGHYYAVVNTENFESTISFVKK